MGAVVYKICRREEWAVALQQGSYTGSADDVRDGFIHFSSAEQLAGTAAKYFAREEDLVLIAVDGQELGASLRFEPSRNGELFPHLYAPLDPTKILWLEPLAFEAGKHVWPPRLGR